MIDTVEYQRKFENALLQAGCTKLDEPTDTDQFVCCAMRFDTLVNFNMLFWLPALDSIIKQVVAEFDSQFYRTEVVVFGEDVLVISCGCGNDVKVNPGQLSV